MSTERDRLLADAFQAARQKWPELETSEADYAAHVLSRFDEVPTAADLAELCLEDLYLACACVHKDKAAFPAFEAHCRTPIEATLARILREPAQRDEGKQIVHGILFVGEGERGPAIAGYSGRGAIRSWVRIITSREAFRLQRKAREQIPVDDERLFDVLMDSADVETELLRQRYQAEFRRAFREATTLLERRERTALRLNVLDGLSIDEIGAMFSVHRATAARWLGRAREHLVSQTRTRLMENLNLSEGEIDSVIRLIRTGLDLTLGSALRTKT